MKLKEKYVKCKRYYNNNWSLMARTLKGNAFRSFVNMSYSSILSVAEKHDLRVSLLVVLCMHFLMYFSDILLAALNAYCKNPVLFFLFVCFTLSSGIATLICGFSVSTYGKRTSMCHFCFFVSGLLGIILAVCILKFIFLIHFSL